MQAISPNKYTITIDGTGYTKYVPFPLKYSRLLDEQLDEGSLSLIRTTQEIFQPFTPVVITIWNESAPTLTRTLNMYVATDESVEMPTGSGLYNHEITLVEQTKLLEGIFPRSHGYVNALVRDYSDYTLPAIPKYTNEDKKWIDFINAYPLKTINLLLLLPNITIPSLSTLFTNAWDDGKLINIESGSMRVEFDGNEIYFDTGTYTQKGDDLQLNITRTGVLTVTYFFQYLTINNEGAPPSTIPGNTIVYNVSLTSSGIAPQKWTIRSVIRRALDISIPLRKGDTPRFSLDGDNPLYLGRFDTLEQLQAVPKDTLTYNAANSNIFYSSSAFVGEYGSGSVYKWDGGKIEWVKYSRKIPVLTGQALDFEYILAPEFQFTQSNLREILQGVGQFIHGEPRLNGNVITYDMYGGTLPASIPSRYASISLSQGIERFATSIDSNVGNLIDSINYSRGLRVEPYADGIKALRTEAVYARVEEGNMFIATDRPINSVEKAEFYYDGVFYDITPYVFEEADYGQMSSYSEAYPYSKGYAVYYTRGSNNIKGLNFKIPNAINTSVFSNYSIVNIIRSAMGNQTWTPPQDYATLAFRVTYQPMIAARVQQSKQNIGDVKEERSIAYNQGQNVIEAHYYGENMKGLVDRLGNVDKVITTAQYGIGTPPEIGTLWTENNEEYYVSSVAVEVNAFVTKMTIALTKNFNRYSAYVALDRQKRQYEISERAAYDSFYSYRDYCVIGNGISNTATLITDPGLLKNVFTQNGTYRPLTVMFLQGEDNYGNELQQVALACQSLAMGNAAVFTASYMDNYSAGVATTYRTVGNVSGYFTNSVPYSDFFGNFKYLHMQISESAEIQGSETLKDVSHSVPSAAGLIPSNTRINTGDKPLLIEKGSTEVLNINYQIDFVTNRNEIIVGSALAKNLVIGSQEGHAAKLYLLPYRLNKYQKVIDLSTAVEIPYTINDIITTSTYINNTQNNTGKPYAAYAFVDGKTNELLFGANRYINNGSYVLTDDQNVGLSLSFTHTLK